MAAPKQTAEHVSTGLLKVMERAKRDQTVQFRSLACHIDGQALQRIYHNLRKEAAVGVDGITHQAYGEQLGVTSLFGGCTSPRARTRRGR